MLSGKLGAVQKQMIQEMKCGAFSEVDAAIEAAYQEYSTVLDLRDWSLMSQSLSSKALLAKGATILVDQDDCGSLRGCVAYYPPGHSDPRIFPKDWASIRALSVIPQFRRTGIGRALTERCIELAALGGAEKIGLHTSQIMNTARGLYERIGFEIVSELPSRFGLRYWLFQKKL